MRLDKLLANMGYGSRKDVKELIKKRRVTVNGKIKRNGRVHIDPANDQIYVDDEQVRYRKYIYIMMNKAPGYVSATVDRKERTVVELLPQKFRHFNPFPVGRLDKDTVGLLLLTNDGELAHLLTAPRNAIEKTYYVKVDGVVGENDVIKCKQGITLDDGYVTKPASLKVISSNKISEVELTITEGKFHQVKRMFASLGKQVLFLKRMKMGELLLDESLRPGDFRELTKDELNYCLSLKQ